MSLSQIKRRNLKTVLVEDGVEYFWLNWCTGYYNAEFCKKQLKELKKEYKNARRGSSVVEYDGKTGKDVRYYRLQVLVPKTKQRV